jgi:threonyl-tRNA synthetase
VQVLLPSLTDEVADFTRALCRRMQEAGIRAEADVRDETIGYKVRDAIEKRVPYIGVIGKKEMEGGSISVRKRGENKSVVMGVDEFIARLKAETAERG